MASNRRSFFKTLAVAAAGFSILPAATTYVRKWGFESAPIWVPNPEYADAPFELSFIWNSAAISVVKSGPNPETIRFVNDGAGLRPVYPHILKNASSI